MSLTNEDLLAISEIVQSQIYVVKQDIRDTKLFLENNILPRLQNIEECYVSTYYRYQSSINHIESMQTDIDIIKKVVTEHSERMKMTS